MPAPIDPSLLDVNIVDSFLADLRTTISDLDGNIKKVRDALNKVESSKNDTLTSMMQQLGIEGHFKTIDDFWKDAEKQVGQISKEINKVTKRVDDELAKNTNFVRIGFYVIGGFFILMTTIAFFICIRLLMRGIKMRLYARPSAVNVGTCIFGVVRNARC